MRSNGDIRFSSDSDGDLCIHCHATFPPRLLGWVMMPRASDGLTQHVTYLMGGVTDWVPEDIGRRFPGTPAGLEAAESWARATILGGEEKP